MQYIPLHYLCCVAVSNVPGASTLAGQKKKNKKKKREFSDAYEGKLQKTVAMERAHLSITDSGPVSYIKVAVKTLKGMNSLLES